MVSINPFTEHKGIFFVDSEEKATWLQGRGNVMMRGGRASLLWKWSPRENSVILRKFRQGWIVLRGLPFHLWNKEQLSFVIKNWGIVTEVHRESLKLVDLTKVKLWVALRPNVVLPTMLEMANGAWLFTVAVAVMGGEEGDRAMEVELTRCSGESLPARENELAISKRMCGSSARKRE